MKPVKLTIEPGPLQREDVYDSSLRYSRFLRGSLVIMPFEHGLVWRTVLGGYPAYIAYMDR